MSAADIETIRHAAALMRERAEAATPGPWSNRRGPGEHVVRADSGAPLANTNTRTDRRHISSWHPFVALAVADWLDQTAGDWQLIEDGVLWSRAITWDATKVRALAVARTYLGEQ